MHPIKIIGTLLLFILLLSMCKNKEKVRRRDILEDEKFIEVLIDMHMADGIMSSTNVRQDKKNIDSVSIYNYVLKKNNISRFQFVKTVEYYTLHPEQYVIFYDSVESHFKRLDETIKSELRFEKEVEKKRDSTNLWILKETWKLPEDGKTNPIAFKIETDKHGIYLLRARIKVFKDDQSVNQRMTIIANYVDGTKDLNTIGTFLKEEKFEEYEVTLATDTTKKLQTISGWILDHSKGTKSKHVHIEKIEIRRLDDIY